MKTLNTAAIVTFLTLMVTPGANAQDPAPMKNLICAAEYADIQKDQPNCKSACFGYRIVGGLLSGSQAITKVIYVSGTVTTQHKDQFVQQQQQQIQQQQQQQYQNVSAEAKVKNALMNVLDNKQNKTFESVIKTQDTLIAAKKADLLQSRVCLSFIQ